MVAPAVVRVVDHSNLSALHLVAAWASVASVDVDAVVVVVARAWAWNQVVAALHMDSVIEDSLAFDLVVDEDDVVVVVVAVVKDAAVGIDFAALASVMDEHIVHRLAQDQVQMVVDHSEPLALGQVFEKVVEVAHL